MSQYDNFYASTPPAPPPKSNSNIIHNNDTSIATQSTTQSPRPPPPVPQDALQQYPPHYAQQQGQHIVTEGDVGRAGSSAAVDRAPLDPGENFLPSFLEDFKSKQDLTTILQSPALLSALTHSPQTTIPSTQQTTTALTTNLDSNIELATHLIQLESTLQQLRNKTQAQLISTHALERQWRAKQSEMDTALVRFAPSSLYQALVRGIVEQEGICEALEESFLEGGGGAGGGSGQGHGHGQSSNTSNGVGNEEAGRNEHRHHNNGGHGSGNGREDSVASEREVVDWLRRYREAKKTGYLREERRERWDEGRVGGWR